MTAADTACMQFMVECAAVYIETAPNRHSPNRPFSRGKLDGRFNR